MMSLHLVNISRVEALDKLQGITSKGDRLCRSNDVYTLTFTAGLHDNTHATNIAITTTCTKNLEMNHSFTRCLVTQCLCSEETHLSFLRVEGPMISDTIVVPFLWFFTPTMDYLVVTPSNNSYIMFCHLLNIYLTTSSNSYTTFCHL